MANGKFVAYFRVSTVKQGASGLGLEAQQEAVRAYLNGGRWKMVAEFTEIESGKRNDRPALAQALSLCELHKATLVVAKMDRLARNVHFISSLMESGVEFIAVDFPQANRLTIHILAAVAEHEAAMISARTKSALAAAKAKGVSLGGDRGNIREIASKGRETGLAVRQAKAAKRNNNLLLVIRRYQDEGAYTLWQIADRLNADGIDTPRGGGSWQATQIKRILERANKLTS